MQLKTTAYLTALIPVLAFDRVTKALALTGLPAGIPRQVLGNVLRFTLVFNRDAAMNITLGSWSRWGFALIATLGVIFMIRLLRSAAPGDWLRAGALGSISAGAIGNLIDRLRWDRGVIDFIDVGLGSLRFWTFNVADIGVSLGAVLLAYVLWKEGREVKGKR